MTLQGAIQELYSMRSDENFTFYYKPVIDKVIETLEMDAQEVRRGRWETEITTNRDGTKSARYACSVCGVMALDEWHYCPNCGARMEGEQNG